jgi:hypothetical protein
MRPGDSDTFVDVEFLHRRIIHQSKQEVLRLC